MLDALELNLLDRQGNPVPVLASYVFVDLDGERYAESAYKEMHVRKELEKRLIAQNENLEKSVRERTVDLQNQKDSAPLEEPGADGHDRKAERA